MKKKTVATGPKAIFGPAGTLVFLAKKMLCIAKAIAYGTGTMVCRRNSLGAVPKTTIKAAKKLV